MPITVVPYSDEWPAAFERVAATLRAALAGVPGADVEHVGSTSVPGLAAKPVLDVDVVVAPDDVPAAVRALESVGYVHRGDLGVAGREAFHAPDDDPVRHVYVCARGTLNVRNHLAVRDVLRRRADLRDEYGAVKRSLADEPGMDIVTYVARKSGVLQKVLAESDLTAEERDEILRLNTDLGEGGPVPATGTGEVVLVCGPAGSGKTTYARRLAAGGRVLLSFDDEAWRLGHRDHPLAPDVAAAVHDDLQRRLVEHVRAGDDVVVDTSFWSREGRDAYRRVLAPCGVVPVVHYVKTPRDVVLARLARRRNTAGDDVAVPPERALAYLDGFEVPTPDEGPLVVVAGTGPA